MNEKKTKPDNLISVQEAARRTGVEPQFIRRMIRNGKIKVLKLGYRTQRIAESELRRYWESLGTMSPWEADDE